MGFIAHIVGTTRHGYGPTNYMNANHVGVRHRLRLEQFFKAVANLWFYGFGQYGGLAAKRMEQVPWAYNAFLD
jgi:hypothetical protein